jgi:hypothetical protein
MPGLTATSSDGSCSELCAHTSNLLIEPSAKKAIELYLEVMREDDLPVPTVERGRVTIARG